MSFTKSYFDIIIALKIMHDDAPAHFDVLYDVD